MIFRPRSHNYSAFHVQVNSIPKGITTHVYNKMSDFSSGDIFWDSLYSTVIYLCVSLPIMNSLTTFSMKMHLMEDCLYW
jgi:hypothetical protein